ncbi:MAG: hypothetical protein R3E35_11840 [Rhodocyclaceae bacterium]
MKLILAIIVIPPILFFFGQEFGLIPSGTAGYAAATSVAIVQGIVLVPVVVIYGYRVFQAPQKYISLKSVSLIDYALIGALLFLVVLGVISKHGNF